MKPDYPILEHDYDTESKLEPSRLIQPRDVPEVCVVTFFREVICLKPKNRARRGIAAIPTLNFIYLERVIAKSPAFSFEIPP
jgi:hypothetical protein